MKEVKRLKRELAYEGTILKVYKDYVEVANGNHAVWDYIHHMGAAAVIPVLDDGRILMVRQYRNALDRFTLELPAGKVDKEGESKKVCAARELEEETGYVSDDMELLISMDTFLAFCDEEIEVYTARNLKPGHKHLDEDEDVETVAMTVEELMAMIDRQELKDAKTIAGILAYYARYVVRR